MRRRNDDKLDLMAQSMMTDEQYQKFKLLEKQQNVGKERTSLIGHVTSYLMVNGMMVMIWAFTDPGEYFWPVWVIVPWGIGLAGHILAYSSLNKS